MYVIQILDKNKKPVGPTFFTGSDEKYKTYNEGKAAAMMWIKNSDNPDQYTIDSRIMGCL
jgi:hypothetical protein